MQTKEQFKDRIQLPLHFDVDKLRQEAMAHKPDKYEYYSVMPLRAPAHLVDPSLPEPPPADDYADGSWTNWMDTEIMDKTPYIKSIVDQFEAYTTVNLVRLLYLAPGSVVKDHKDPTLALEEEKSMIRLTIPIDNNEGVAFFLNGTEVPMKEGECWYMRLSETHRVLNKGESDRINLTIDVIPNDKIVQLIREAN